MDCIFCKIVSGDVPSNIVYEDDTTMAFIPLGAVNLGHTLVIPKEHYKDYLVMTDDIVQDVATTVKVVGNAIKKAVDADGLNIISNIESAAGQVVFHTHIHVIPRFMDDGYKSWPLHEYPDEEKIGVAEEIKNVLQK